jgi:hypothetical protein
MSRRSTSWVEVELIPAAPPGRLAILFNNISERKRLESRPSDRPVFRRDLHPGRPRRVRPRTAKTHRAKLLRKLGLPTRADPVRIVISRGFIAMQG